MAQLGLVLEQYTDEVVEHVSSPLTGVQRKQKFPPTISEIVEACDNHAERLAWRNRPQRAVIPREPSPRLREAPDGYLAQVWVDAGHPRYPSLVAWSETAERVYWKYGVSSEGKQGIRVPWNIWTEGVRKPVREQGETGE